MGCERLRVRFADSIGFANLSGFVACALPKTPSSFLGAFIPAVRIPIEMDHLIAYSEPPQAVLDCYAFALLLGNALSRPRSASQHLLDMLLRDGLVYFLVRLRPRSRKQLADCTFPGRRSVFVSNHCLGCDPVIDLSAVTKTINIAVTAAAPVRVHFFPCLEYEHEDN